MIRSPFIPVSRISYQNKIAVFQSYILTADKVCRGYHIRSHKVMDILMWLYALSIVHPFPHPTAVHTVRALDPLPSTIGIRPVRLSIFRCCHLFPPASAEAASVQMPGYKPFYRWGTGQIPGISVSLPWGIRYTPHGRIPYRITGLPGFFLPGYIPIRPGPSSL